MKSHTRRHCLLAFFWLLLLLFIAGFLALQRTAYSDRVDTDLLALLPRDGRHPALEAALKALSAKGERQLAFLVSTTDAARTRQAAQMLRSALADAEMTEENEVAAAAFPIDFYFPYRQGLMSEADREWLSLATPEEAQSRALALAYTPFAAGGIHWLSDPFGFFGNWLQSLGEATPLRPSGGELMVEHEGRIHAALIYTLSGSAFDRDLQETLMARLDAAQQALRQAFPEARLLRAGVALHAAAAARQAEEEMRLIGLGSLFACFLLVGLIFQSARALKLIFISLVSGTLVAIFCVFSLFDRVHIITMVFGASLIGVAADYAILVFAQHLGNTEPSGERFRRLLPTLCMVLIAPALAYLALALTPFPGLKQMAVFAVCGIFGAWMSVVCFYPYLLPQTLPLPGNAYGMARLLDRWPRWKNTPKARGMALVLAVFVTGGLAQLRTNDDIRSLFTGNPGLMAEQGEVSAILKLPSPAQMFLVTAENAEDVLRKEEALIARLRPLMAAGQIDGFEASSRWLPSEARQEENRAGQRKKLAATRKAIAREMELPESWAEETDAPFLTPKAGLNLPFRQGAALWLGETEPGKHASMVLLKGLRGQETAGTLSGLAVEGVTWIDQTRDISDQMQRYRQTLTRTLFAACLLLPLLLYPFFRREVWRLLTPALLAGLTTLAIMGYLGIPAQMLSILALLLTLGMGVDYAIFLAARRTHAHTLLATTLAATLTLASFGLLSLSATPALYALGLTTTLGVTLSWLLTPIFRRG
ncbi:MAG: MMPL family transporter [Zoogloeaceae bacterium]|jgi:predicted exporter|nr:MMPL family transporter [Zoogloeaceae bacterium]